MLTEISEAPRYLCNRSAEGAVRLRINKLFRVADKPDDNAERGEIDFIALGIVAASLIMLVSTASAAGPAILDVITGRGSETQRSIISAAALNVAILAFAVSRFRQLQREIQARKRAERDARRLAETDPLTGFLNRRSFNTEVDRALRTAQADGKPLAILMIDLDNFKQVNDFNGHSAGDLLLLECSRRILNALPEGAIVSRIGGDEFAVAIRFENNRPDPVTELAAQLVESVAQASKISAVTIDVTASVGIAHSNMPAIDQCESNDAHALLEMADIAMYHAKRQGRNGFYWFEAPMADEMRARSELERGIRQGIPGGEFVPYYEPQFDLKSGVLTGFEVLARWDSPMFGVVSPDIFIPIAEEIGAIGELSESIIAQALRDANAWDSGLSLAVNISPLQLRDPWFAQKLSKMLLEAKFPPQRLEIEITESCLHQNIGQVRTLITSLRNQGVRVSLDDFGTGYSSLAQLRSLPFDRIKIDRSFVTSIVENEDNAAIVHAIAMLGKGLNLPITAEGVETDAVLERLQQYGEINGQGYLYGKPRTASETNAWLSDRLETATQSGPEAPRRDEVAALRRLPATDESSPSGMTGTR